MSQRPDKPLRDFTFEERNDWLLERLQPLIDDHTIISLEGSHEERQAWTDGFPGKCKKGSVLYFRIYVGTAGTLDFYITDDYHLTLDTIEPTGQKEAWKADLFAEYVRRVVKANYWHMNDY